MPSESKAQQRYFGYLYSKIKSGDTSGLSDKDRKTLDSMNAYQIRHYAKTKHNGWPAIKKTASIITIKTPIILTRNR